MPTSEIILAGLAEISLRFRPFAIGWHVLLSAGVLAWLLGWHPSRQGVATMLSTLPLSASLCAFAGDVPFNGMVMLLVAALSWLLGWRFGSQPAEHGPAWQLAVGIVMIAFGWTYPHFVDGGSMFMYLFAAPTGLLPCPTLSLVVGFGLAFRGLDSRAWSATMAAAGLLYGLFGTFRLGVTIDVTLSIGALALAWVAFAKRPQPRDAEHARVVEPARSSL